MRWAPEQQRGTAPGAQTLVENRNDVGDFNRSVDGIITKVSDDHA
jgi:hypothetical protein